MATAAREMLEWKRGGARQSGLTAPIERSRAGRDVADLSRPGHGTTRLAGTGFGGPIVRRFLLYRANSKLISFMNARRNSLLQTRWTLCR